MGQGDANRLGPTVWPTLAPYKDVCSLVPSLWRPFHNYPHQAGPQFCFLYMSRINSRPLTGRSSNQFNLMALR